MIKYGIIISCLLLTLSSCTTNIQSNPARTATEEMLISTASDRAAEKLMPEIPADKTVFIESSNFEGTDGKYAIASIRSHLLQGGIRLANDKKNADIILEIRAGALSTDRKSFMIGIPQFNIPIPLASSPLPFPEISFYGKEEQKGVAKFAYAAYDSKKGTLVAVQEPQYGFSHSIKKTVLVLISWTDSDYLPENAETEKIVTNEDSQKEAKPHMEINGNGYSPASGAPSTSSQPIQPKTLPAIAR